MNGPPAPATPSQPDHIAPATVPEAVTTPVDHAAVATAGQDGQEVDQTEDLDQKMLELLELQISEKSTALADTVTSLLAAVTSHNITITSPPPNYSTLTATTLSSLHSSLSSLPPPSLDTTTAFAAAGLREWERWYHQTVARLLSLLQANRTAILQITTPYLLNEEYETIETIGDRTVDRRESRNDLTTPPYPLTIFLADTYLTVLKTATHHTLTSLLSLNQNNMTATTSQFTMPSYEKARWDFFRDLTEIIIDVPNRVVDTLFPPLTKSPRGSGDAGTSSSTENGATSNGTTAPTVNFFTAQLKISLLKDWKDLCATFTDDLSNPVSHFISTETKKCCYDFDPATLQATLDGPKAAEQAAATTPLRRMSAISTTPPPAFLSLANSHHKILDAANAIAELLKIFTPLLALCSLATRPPPLQPPPTGTTAPPPTTYTPTTPPLLSVFLTTIATSTHRFTTWLLYTATHPSHPAAHPTLAAALLATTLVAFHWRSAVSCMTSPGSLANVSEYERRQLSVVGGHFIKTERRWVKTIVLWPARKVLC